MRGRAGTCLSIFPTMFIRQTDYEVSQCVYGKAGSGGGRKGRRLAVVLYFLSSFLASLLSLIDLSQSRSFFPCAAHLYPPALRGGRLLGFDFIFPPSHIEIFARIVFSFFPSSIRLHTLPCSSSTTTTLLSSSYLSAKISWSDVETDEEMNKTTLVLAAHRGPGKGAGVGLWRVGRGWEFISSCIS